MFVVTLGSKVTMKSGMFSSQVFFVCVYIGNHWQRRKQTIGEQCCAPPGRPG